MATQLNDLLVVIVGPTASGKTQAAIDLAIKYGGEIICADSRTVYRGMDIGTAKPSLSERRGISHWGLDLVNPDEKFSAAAFQDYAETKIREIRQRSRLPIVVGGTGLYTDGLVFNFAYPRPASSKEREDFERMDVKHLYNYCIQNNIELPLNDKNKRHLVRTIFHKDNTDKKLNYVDKNTIYIGIVTEPAELRERIHLRTEQIFNSGIEQEASKLASIYGWGSEAMTGNVYPLMKDYIQGVISKDEAKQAFEHKDWQLAKRQMTWFRRNEHMLWAKRHEISNYLDNRITRLMGESMV